MLIEALPANQLEEYQTGNNRGKKGAQSKILSYVTNYIARTHNLDSVIGSSTLQQSLYLDLSITR